MKEVSESRSVRFLLSPPLEESMAMDRDQYARRRKPNTSQTTDLKEREERFGGANEWGRKSIEEY